MKDNYPLVSIAMVTYNHELFIGQALDSILMQKTNFNFEIVIGEDCSSDETRKVILQYKNKYPDKFKLLLRDKNMGATKNLYDVFLNCTGKYIALLEGDDYWTDEYKLQKQIDFLRENPEYSGVSHIVDVINEDNKIESSIPNEKLLEAFKVMEITGVDQFLQHYMEEPGQIIHTQSLCFVNVFNNDFENLRALMTSTKFISDTQVKLLILENGKIKIINEKMGVYRKIEKVGGTSFSSQKLDSNYQEIKKMWDVINCYFEDKYKSVISKILERFTFIFICQCMYKRHIKVGVGIWYRDLSLWDKIIFVPFLFSRTTIKIINYVIEN